MLQELCRSCLLLLVVLLLSCRGVGVLTSAAAAGAAAGERAGLGPRTPAPRCLAAMLLLGSRGATLAAAAAAEAPLLLQLPPASAPPPASPMTDRGRGVTVPGVANDCLLLLVLTALLRVRLCPPDMGVGDSPLLVGHRSGVRLPSLPLALRNAPACCCLPPAAAMAAATRSDGVRLTPPGAACCCCPERCAGMRLYPSITPTAERGE